MLFHRRRPVGAGIGQRWLEQAYVEVLGSSHLGLMGSEGSLWWFMRDRDRLVLHRCACH